MEQIGVTVEEARQISRVGRNEIYKAIATGELAAAKIGRRMVIPRSELERWLFQRAGISRAVTVAG